jgi:hypothetical protein
MAAIDKMYLKDYYVFDEFRLWCLIHNPKLLKSFYHWNITQQEWDQYKENKYRHDKELCDNLHPYFSNIESLQQYYLQVDVKISQERLAYEVSEHLRWYDTLKNKAKCIEDWGLAVTCFSCKEDKYLLWHCPIEEVREYLTKQCGYKERWYYKLFFKY